MNVKNIVNKVYPAIAKDYKSNAKVEIYSDIFTRLNSVSVMDEDESYAEYSWDTNKIYLYTDNLNSEEDIIRSLIHECVHSRQLKCTFDSFYENGHTYDTHPYEIEARNAEEEWEIYLNEIEY